MATNERIVWDDKDIENHLQEQQVTLGRQYWTPGTQTPAKDWKPHSTSPLQINNSKILAQNWPVEFDVKVGIPAIDNLNLFHERVIKLKRDSVCDQVISAPVVNGTHVRTQTQTAVSGTHTYTDTVTENNNGQQERRTGSDDGIIS